MKAKILKSMLAEKFPHYRELNGIYFLPDFNHILTGFVVERRGVGIFLWKFRYPLFDLSENLSLLYSDIFYRVSFQDLKSGMIKENDFYVSIIDKVAELCVGSISTCSTEDFSKYFKCNDKLSHPKIRMACGICSLLADHFSEAKENLLISLSFLEGVYFERCRTILELIKKDDIDGAKIYILGLEKQMIMNLVSHPSVRQDD